MSEMLEILKEKSRSTERAWQIIFSGGATPVQVAAFLCQNELNSVIDALNVLQQNKQERRQAILISDLAHRRTKRRNLELPISAIFNDLGHKIILNDRCSNIPENAIAKHNSSADILFEMGLKPHLEKHYGLDNNIIFSEIFHFQPKLKLIYEIEQQIGFRGFFKLLKTFVQPINASHHLIFAENFEQISLIQEILRYLGFEKAVIIFERLDDFLISKSCNDGIFSDYEISKQFSKDESFVPSKNIEINGQKMVKLLKSNEDSEFSKFLRQIVTEANSFLFDKNHHDSENEIDSVMAGECIAHIRLFIEKANLRSMENNILYKDKKNLYKATLDKIKQKIDEGAHD